MQEEPTPALHDGSSRRLVEPVKPGVADLSALVPDALRAVVWPLLAASRPRTIDHPVSSSPAAYLNPNPTMPAYVDLLHMVCPGIGCGCLICDSMMTGFSRGEVYQA